MRATGLGRHQRAREPGPGRHAGAPAQDVPVGEGRHRTLVVVDIVSVLRQLVPVDGRAPRTAIAKLTGVSRTALYSFMNSRGLGPRRR